MIMNPCNRKHWTRAIPRAILCSGLGAVLTSTSFAPAGFAAAVTLPEAPRSSRSFSAESNPALIAQSFTDTEARKALEVLGTGWEDWYVVYRIVDRIARANQIDQTPWRIRIVPQYDVNAFASEANLLSFYSGLLDQVAGDSSAIACVVGHEMAHHTARHIAVSASERAKIVAEIEAKARQEVDAEIKDANGTSTAAAVGGGLANIFGVPILGRVLNNEANNRQTQAQQRVNEIVATRKAELAAKLSEQSRNNEFEADKLGYTYIAKAGFDPKGCLRVMEVLGRMPGSESDTSHPATPKRIEALEKMMQDSPAAKLKPEGDRRIRATKPLTLSVSKDDRSLRVNSARGGSAIDDFDKQFGK
jgi:beta-barrel assembly-enhancing protease